jgi:hypothetical protein
MAISSVFVVDVIKPLFPSIGDRALFVWAKAPMVLAAAVAALVARAVLEPWRDDWRPPWQNLAWPCCRRPR